MKKSMLLLCIVCITAIRSPAQKSEVFINSGNVAVKGYDVVAYFTESKAVAGNSSFLYEWNNVIWYFTNQQNLDSFKALPEKFAPQYGGYCAYGISEGHKAPTDPDAWTIVNGKLYLNYNADVQKMWVKNRQTLIDKADKKWVHLKDSE